MNLDSLANGAKIYYQFDTPLGTIKITQTMVSLLVVTIALIIIAAAAKP